VCEAHMQTRQLNGIVTPMKFAHHRFVSSETSTPTTLSSEAEAFPKPRFTRPPCAHAGQSQAQAHDRAGVRRRRTKARRLKQSARPGACRQIAHAGADARTQTHAADARTPGIGADLRGCGEGWANHFSVQTRKESALIIEFVSESHVAELIQHQKVIDYTATYNGLPQPSSAFFGLLRAFHSATLHHTAKRRLDHIQQPTVQL